MMMQGGDSVSPYPDPWVDDGKIWAYYNITQTETATNLAYAITDFSAMEVDGQSVTLAKSYQFTTTGEHLVKFVPKNTTISQSVWRSNANPPVKRVYIPSTITALSDATFYDVGSLTHIFGCTGVTTLGSNVIRCANLESPILFPSLTSMTGTASIRKGFGDVLSLGRITVLPNSNLSSGSAGIHAKCSKIILPETIQSIGSDCIWRIYNLRELYVLAINPPTLGSGCFNGMTNFVIKVPASSVDAYKEAAGWSSFASKIQAI